MCKLKFKSIIGGGFLHFSSTYFFRNKKEQRSIEHL